MSSINEDSHRGKAALRISLDPDQKTEFGEIAEKYHNGNRSALIRHAVYLYRRLMESPGEIPGPNQIIATLDDIEADLEGMGSRLQELTDEDLSENRSRASPGSPEKIEAIESNAESSTTPAAKDDVLDLLNREYPDGCSLSDLVSQTEFTEFEICRSLD